MRARYHYSAITVFNDLQPFGQKTVARRVTITGVAASKVQITIDMLEPATNVNEAIFTVAGVKPVFTTDTEDERFTQPVAVYTVTPSVPGWHGHVTCALQVDEHGHVRDVDVQGTTDESVIKPIRAALMNWEYEPGTINGHPSLDFVQVNVR